MNEEQTKRYHLLKEKNKRKLRDENWKHNLLFQECINSLNNCEILFLENTEKIFNKLIKIFPITFYGSIDWNKFNGIMNTEEMPYLYQALNLKNKYYVLWDMQDTPSVICDLSTILNNLYDVLAVSFNTWLLSLSGQEVIEFYHGNIVTYGRLDNEVSM